MRCLSNATTREGLSLGHHLLWETDNNEQVEGSMLFIQDHEPPWVACLPVSVGCSMGCSFCALPKKSNPRKLTSSELWEMFEQSVLDYQPSKPFQVTFMGQGEPLFNPNNLIEFCSKASSHWPDLRFGISTVGIAAGIRQLLTEEWAERLKLQISLHALPSEKRLRMVPAERNFPIEAALLECINFSNHFNKKVYLSCTLIEGWNDSEMDAFQIAQVAKRGNFCVKVCDLNTYPGCKSTPSSKENTSKYCKILEEENIDYYRFKSIGRDIGIGCGQTRLPKGRLKL